MSLARRLTEIQALYRGIANGATSTRLIQLIQSIARWLAMSLGLSIMIPTQTVVRKVRDIKSSFEPSVSHTVFLVF